MPVNSWEIRPIDIRAAGPEEYAQLNAFENVLRLESLPDDPAVPLSEDIARWKGTAALIEQASWAAWQGTPQKIIAFAWTRIYHTGDNPHLVDFMIEVLPEFRRRGLGRLMLSRIVDHARGHNRRLMVVESLADIPATGAFLARIGGRKGLEAGLNQLRLADLDRGLIQGWLQAARPLEAAFTLGLWEQRYPEERLPAVSDLLQVVGNDQPRDTLEVEDENYSQDNIRQFQEMMLASGAQRRILYVLDRKDGRLAALTEIFWNPNSPAILQQAFTGVLPDYRGRGLGRWVKAEMLTRVLREWPQAEVIRTGNANSNAPMLKINLEMGFKPYRSWSIWQVDTTTAEKYLKEQS